MTLAIDRHTVGPGSTSTASQAHSAAATIDELVRQHLPLVGHLVREVSARVPAHVHRDDLVSAAMYALAASAKSFDPSLGAPFGRFASIRIRGALTDELRSMDWASRAVRGKARQVDATRSSLAQVLGRIPTSTEIARAMGVATSELATIESDTHRACVVQLQALSTDESADLVPERAEGPEALVLKREQVGYLRDAIALLPDRLRTVVEQYFFQQRKMTDIAEDLGVTESRVSQLRSEALAMLREGMRCANEDVVAAPAPVGHGKQKRAAATAAYRASVATRSTLAGRLAASNVLGECSTTYFAPLPSAG
jgi:RNA polymerase sigma factor for flagellar operon FliA